MKTIFHQNWLRSRNFLYKNFSSPFPGEIRDVEGTWSEKERITIIAGIEVPLEGDIKKRVLAYEKAFKVAAEIIANRNNPENSQS